MTTADYSESLHHAMCSKFNAEYITSDIKMDLVDNKSIVQDAIAQATSIKVKDEKMLKPLKSDENLPVMNEPSMELLLSSMSSTFDAECATSTDEAGSMLNHDLAEDKTIKWRNLANNKFAYKRKVNYNGGRRTKKQDNKLQKTSNYLSSNENNNKPKNCEKRLTRSDRIFDKQSKRCGRKSNKMIVENVLHRELPTEHTEKHINDSFKTELTVCKEELIVDDDNALLLVPDANEVDENTGGNALLITKKPPADETIEATSIPHNIADVALNKS